MNTGNHIEGNRYTDYFLSSMQKAHNSGQSWVSVSNALNGQGMQPIYADKWTAANIAQAIKRFEPATVAHTDEEGEPNFTMEQLVNHPNLDKILSKLNSVRDTTRQLRKLANTRKASLVELDKIARG